MIGTYHRNARVRAALLLLALVCAPVFASAERVALVVGNAVYERERDRLPNPANDADAIAGTLEAAGFQVIRGLNLTQRAFYDKLSEFEGKAAGAEVSLFFYAGHGVTWEGESYLVPVDVTLETRTDINVSVPLTRVMETLRSETNIVFLDACRDAPMLEDLALATGQTRSAASKLRGATRVSEEAIKENHTLIVYATKDGRPAQDGFGDNSPFTEALLANITRPGVSLMAMLPDIASAVEELSRERQTPSVQGILLQHFAFVEQTIEITVQDGGEGTSAEQPGVSVAAAVPAAAVQAVGGANKNLVLVPVSPPAPEAAPPPGDGAVPDPAFARAKAAGTVQAYQQYVSANPDAPHVEEARKRIKALRGAMTGLVSKDNATWALARKSRDPVDCDIYLEAYPAGIHARAAKKCLAAAQ